MARVKLRCIMVCKEKGLLPTCMAEDCPPGTISLPSKSIKNIKIADPVFAMNSFYD